MFSISSAEFWIFFCVEFQSNYNQKRSSWWSDNEKWGRSPADLQGLRNKALRKEISEELQENEKTKGSTTATHLAPTDIQIKKGIREQESKLRILKTGNDIMTVNVPK